MNWFDRAILDLDALRDDGQISQSEYDDEYEELLDQRNYGIEEDIDRAVDEQNRARDANSEW